MTIGKFILPAVAFSWLFASSVLTPQMARGEWQEHRIRQGDGKGGWMTRPALRQVLKHPDADFTMPFGLVRMEKGEIAIICSLEKERPKRARTFEPIIAFSKDDGATWTDFRIIPGISGRPINLTDHGGGRLSFVVGRRYFSNDYGRTWKESVDHPLTTNGRPFNLEGNAWVDRDGQGRAKAILEVGDYHEPGKRSFKDDWITGVYRRSVDGGKTWNLDRRYELDGFDFVREDGYWVDGKTGHIGAVALPDGHVVSAYGHYR